MFRIDSYLQPDEAYHFVRKELDPASPALAHDHDFYEVFLIESGRARHWINGGEDALERGDLVFIRPRDLHALQADADLGCRILNVIFREATGRHLVDRYGDAFDGRFFWRDTRDPQRIRLEGLRLERAINHMHLLQDRKRTLVRIEQFLLTLMTFVLDEVDMGDTSMPAWLAEACRAARAPVVFRQGGAGFVAVAGRGHEHVCRQARRHLGMSPTQYVNRIRVQHAAMRLSARDTTTLEEIAAECGFENLSYFHRLFRLQYGTTPNEFRRRRRRDPIQSGEPVG